MPCSCSCAADAHLGLSRLPIKSGALVWVLPVAHFLHLFELQVEGARVVLGATCRLGSQSDWRSCRHKRRCARRHGSQDQIASPAWCAAVMGFEFSEDPTVVAGRHHDGDVAVVLCGGTNHGRSADINIFHRVFQRAVRPCDGGLEGIQVHHHKIDGRISWSDMTSSSVPRRPRMPP